MVKVNESNPSDFWEFDAADVAQRYAHQRRLQEFYALLFNQSVDDVDLNITQYNTAVGVSYTDGSSSGLHHSLFFTSGGVEYDSGEENFDKEVAMAMIAGLAMQGKHKFDLQDATEEEKAIFKEALEEFNDTKLEKINETLPDDQKIDEIVITGLDDATIRQGNAMDVKAMQESGEEPDEISSKYPSSWAKAEQKEIDRLGKRPGGDPEKYKKLCEQRKKQFETVMQGYTPSEKRLYIEYINYVREKRTHNAAHPVSDKIDVSTKKRTFGQWFMGKGKELTLNINYDGTSDWVTHLENKILNNPRLGQDAIDGIREQAEKIVKTEVQMDHEIDKTRGDKETREKKAEKGSPLDQAGATEDKNRWKTPAALTAATAGLVAVIAGGAMAVNALSEGNAATAAQFVEQISHFTDNTCIFGDVGTEAVNNAGTDVPTDPQEPQDAIDQDLPEYSVAGLDKVPTAPLITENLGITAEMYAGLEQTMQETYAQYLKNKDAVILDEEDFKLEVSRFTRNTP